MHQRPSGELHGQQYDYVYKGLANVKFADNSSNNAIMTRVYGYRLCVTCRVPHPPTSLDGVIWSVHLVHI